MFKYVTILILAVVFLTGCVSVKYEGQTYPATSGVKLYEDRTLIPEDYVEVGGCVAYGRYDTFNKNEISEKIRSKAEAVGADVVYIYAHQVVPESVVTGAVERVWNDSTSDTLWYTMERDFASYGQIGKETNSAHSHSSYMRVIRAKFLKDPANVSNAIGTAKGNLESVSLNPQAVAPAVEEAGPAVETAPAVEETKPVEEVKAAPAAEEVKPVETTPAVEENKPIEEVKAVSAVEKIKPVETPVVETPVDTTRPVDVKVEKPEKSVAAEVVD